MDLANENVPSELWMPLVFSHPIYQIPYPRIKQKIGSFSQIPFRCVGHQSSLHHPQMSHCANRFYFNCAFLEEGLRPSTSVLFRELSWKPHPVTSAFVSLARLCQMTSHPQLQGSLRNKVGVLIVFFFFWSLASPTKSAFYQEEGIVDTA